MKEEQVDPRGAATARGATEQLGTNAIVGEGGALGWGNRQQGASRSSVWYQNGGGGGTRSVRESVRGEWTGSRREHEADVD